MKRVFEVEVPGLRLGRGRNDRLHFHDEGKQVADEHRWVWMALWNNFRPALGPPLQQFRALCGEAPWLVTLTRSAPARSKELDDDNLSASLKSVRDEVAKWLGVDDGESTRVRFVPLKAKGPWGVRIQVDQVEQFGEVPAGKPVTATAAPSASVKPPGGWVIDRTRGGRIAT